MGRRVNFGRAGPFVGIDLGTTCTVVASADPTGTASVVGDAAGRRRTPSVVTFEDAAAVVGRPGAAGAEREVRSVKTMLGDPRRRLSAACGYVRPEEVSALLLARTTADAERVLGTAVTDAVLTVPASFDFLARRAVRDSAAIAGLSVRHILTEPAAAALAYRRRLPVGEHVLVFGLGGGVAEASVLHVGEDRVEARSTAGDRHLGGWEWDNLTMLLVQERLTTIGGPDLLTGDEDQVRSRTRAAKHRLSTALHTDVVLRRGDGVWRIPLSRADFEAATRRPLARTRALVEDVLAASRVPPAEIARVLVVGGATRMPAVFRMLREFGVSQERSVVPEDAVALGAALYDQDLPVQEVASHGLGVLVRAGPGGTLQNMTILPAGTPLPATRSAVLATGEDGRERVVLEVTLGDGTEPGAVRSVHREVVTLAPERPGARIEVRCGYDDAEVPRVEVWEVSANRLLSRFVVESEGAMSTTDLCDATRRVAHPSPPRAAFDLGCGPAGASG